MGEKTFKVYQDMDAKFWQRKFWVEMSIDGEPIMRFRVACLMGFNGFQRRIRRKIRKMKRIQYIIESMK